MSSLEVNIEIHQRYVMSPSQVPHSPGSPQYFSFSKDPFLKFYDQKMTNSLLEAHLLATERQKKEKKDMKPGLTLSSWNSSFLG